MRKKKPYSGLSPYQARLIRRYLSDVRASGNGWPLCYLWLSMLTGETNVDALAAFGKTDAKTAKAMLAGMAVLKRKKIGRIWDCSPYYSLACIGIQVPHVTKSSDVLVKESCSP